MKPPPLALHHGVEPLRKNSPANDGLWPAARLARPAPRWDLPRGGVLKQCWKQCFELAADTKYPRDDISPRSFDKLVELEHLNVKSGCTGNAACSNTFTRWPS